MTIKNGDMVVVTVPREKNPQPAKVLSVHPKEGRVLVEGKNLKTKNMKRRSAEQRSQQIRREFTIDISNVALWCPKCEKGVRSRSETKDGNKSRVCTKCSEVLG